MNVDGTILVPGILDRIKRKGASISIQAGSHTPPYLPSCLSWALAGRWFTVVGLSHGGHSLVSDSCSCVTSLDNDKNIVTVAVSNGNPHFTLKV